MDTIKSWRESELSKELQQIVHAVHSSVLPDGTCGGNPGGVDHRITRAVVLLLRGYSIKL